MAIRSSVGLPHLSQFGGAFPCGALSGGSDTTTPSALSDNQAKDESSPFSKSASGRWITDRGKFTREGRPSFRGRPCLSDAWLSCAGSGELAPEVGNSEPVNMNQGHSVPPSIGSAARGTYCGTLRRDWRRDRRQYPKAGPQAAAMRASR